MGMHERLRPLALALILILCLSGCAYAGADQLYALPQLSDEYVQLEELIAKRIRDGGEYAAPLGGSHRQSVQFHDLDGDGTPEALAFLADSSHTPTVCVYRLGPEGDYFLFVTIEGVGSAIGSVDYSDLDGSGNDELILSWQLSPELRLLSVYTVGETAQTQLLSTDCSAYFLCDLDADGRPELMSLSVDYVGGCTLIRHVFDAAGHETSSSAMLSSGVTEVLRAKTAYLSDERTALFIESRLGDSELVTDVFTAGIGLITNITLGEDGVSTTRRATDAYAADINADRITELPDTAGDLLDWYSLDVIGRRTPVLTTYHDYEHEWYLVIPEALLRGSLRARSAEEVPGESAVTFTLDGTEILTVYTLTGENRLGRAQEEGRFLLTENGTTVYAAALAADGLVTEDEITENFHLIYNDWQSGEL